MEFKIYIYVIFLKNLMHNTSKNAELYIYISSYTIYHELVFARIKFHIDIFLQIASIHQD